LSGSFDGEYLGVYAVLVVFPGVYWCYGIRTMAKVKDYGAICEIFVEDGMGEVRPLGRGQIKRGCSNYAPLSCFLEQNEVQ
jgi:hypothetical protein